MSTYHRGVIRDNTPPVEHARVFKMQLNKVPWGKMNCAREGKKPRTRTGKVGLREQLRGTDTPLQPEHHRAQTTTVTKQGNER